MLANWVKETVSSAPGTGTIPLGGATASNFITFADGVADGSMVEYFIEDGSNRESGMGFYTAGVPDTISRAKIFETLVAGTFVRTPDGSGTPITMTLNAIVTCSATSRSVASFGTAPQYLFDTTHYRVPDNIPRANNSGTTNANRLWFTRVIFFSPINITEIGIDVKTLDAASLETRIGLYDCAADGSPGNLLVASGNLGITTAGMKTYTVSPALYLPPGVYYEAFVTDSAIAKCARVSNAADFMQPLDQANASAPSHPYRTFTAGALPDPAGTMTDWKAGNNMWMIHYRE